MNTSTLEKMSRMKLCGMQNAFRSLIDSKQQNSLTADELISMLVQSEWEYRENKKFTRSLRNARFRYSASIEEIDFTKNRNLDKNLLLRFTDCSFIEKKQNLLLSGPTGVGKSFIASALGHQACLKGYKVIYYNTQKLFPMLKMSKADGSYMKIISKIERQDLLILDDFGMQPMDNQSGMMLLEIIEDRHDRKATIISSQLPTNKWYDVIAENTVADAILDRLLSNSYKIELKGESLRIKN
jgi:DNA replication protein DnaC